LLALLQLMAEIKILIDGYVKEEGNITFASSTATLIREQGLNIVVDPGMNRKKLLEALGRENICVKDVNKDNKNPWTRPFSLLCIIGN